MSDLIDEIDHGCGISTRYYDDGSVRLAHPCVGGDGSRRVLAPQISKETHQFVAAGNGELVTITPSLVCAACGLHGWVTDSAWRAA